MAGVFHLPDIDGPPPRVIVQAPGWLGLSCGSTDLSVSESYHEAFTDAGYAVFMIDFRGFGGSEGERGWIRPEAQVDDIRNAITYVSSRGDIDGTEVGLFGMGGTGGGNMIYTAASDNRVRAMVVQSVIADGTEWLRRMRPEHEWIDFLGRLHRNQIASVVENRDELVDPRSEIMVATPERKHEATRGPTDRRVGNDFHLSSAVGLLRYRPLDVMPLVSPTATLIIGSELDAVTPIDHSLRLFAAAPRPRKLIIQRGVLHYESYRVCFSTVVPHMVDWFNRYLRGDALPGDVADERVVIDGMVGSTFTTSAIGAKQRWTST